MALRFVMMALVPAVTLLLHAASSEAKELVILHSERWIDTLKGTVKNMSVDRADEVVIVVRFFGATVKQATPHKRKSASRRELGRQTVKLPSLDGGQEAPFEVEIAEPHRTATSFKFEPHAIWRAMTRARSKRR